MDAIYDKSPPLCPWVLYKKGQVTMDTLQVTMDTFKVTMDTFKVTTKHSMDTLRKRPSHHGHFTSDHGHFTCDQQNQYWQAIDYGWSLSKTPLKVTTAN